MLLCQALVPFGPPILRFQDGKAADFDVTVISPLQSEVIARASGNSAEADDAAALLGERRKMDKYRAIYTGNSLRIFVPLAVSTYGGWGPQARGAFDRIIAAESNALRLPQGVIRRRPYGALSLRLIRSNVSAILYRCPDRLEKGQQV